MKYLLDTYILMWWMIESPKLSAHAFELLNNSDIDVAYSAVNMWEIGIKSAINRLEAPEHFPDLVAKQRFKCLPIYVEQVWMASRLPFIHKDPFDRLLVAQAQIESRILLTVDKTLVEYGEFVQLV